MSASLAIAAYINVATKLTTCVLNISGTKTTAQTAVNMDNTTGANITRNGSGISKINTTQFMVNYSLGASGTYGIVGILTGSTITHGTKVQLDSNTGTQDNANVTIDADRVLAFYAETPPALNYVNAIVLKA